MNQSLSVQDLTLHRVVRDEVFFGQIEHLKLFPHLLELEVKVLHLHSHCLVIVDQGSLFFLVHSNLLDEILSSLSLLLILLTEGQALVCLDQLALSIDNNSLELVTLSNQLLSVSIDLLLELQVFLEKGVPLARAVFLTTTVLFD